MEESIRSRIDDILSKTQPSLGGARIKLREIREGIVIIDYDKALANPSCHVNRTQTTEELVAEILEDDLRAVVPNFEKVIVIEEGESPYDP